ncbi:hypothetical protein ACFX2I_037690 [Malus domestica]
MANKAEWKDHSIGGRAPKTQSYHKKFFVHGNLDGRRLDGIINAKNLPFFVKELLYPFDPHYLGRGSGSLGSLGFGQFPLQPIISLKQRFQAVVFDEVSNGRWDIVCKEWSQELMRSARVTFKSHIFYGAPVDEVPALSAFIGKFGDEDVGSHC